jgi:hypothetical protein
MEHIVVAVEYGGSCEEGKRRTNLGVLRHSQGCKICDILLNRRYLFLSVFLIYLILSIPEMLSVLRLRASGLVPFILAFLINDQTPHEHV